MMANRRAMITVALVAALPLALDADTLFLRNGQRIEGELVGVRGRTIEFEERRGSSRRTVRVDRDQVDRIDFNSYGNNWAGGTGGWNSGWAGGSGGGGRPSGLRERQVSVSATEPWSDTGIDVRAGQNLYIDAQGQVRWGKDRRDGPEGEKNSPFNAARPLPNRPGGALIGRIGNDLFFIGAESGPIRVRSGGRLLLGINDEYLVDNSGSFRVTVMY